MALRRHSLQKRLMYRMNIFGLLNQKKVKILSLLQHRLHTEYLLKKVGAHLKKSLFQRNVFRFFCGKPMHATLPLHFTGEAFGVKNENGVIEVHEHEIRVKCRPRDLPEMIVIDVSNLKVGEGIHLKDVKAPEGVEFTSDLEDLLVTCNVIKVEEEPAPVAAEGADAAKAAAPEADAKSAPAAKK